MAKIPSALTQYDNEVTKTTNSNGNFKGKLGGGFNNSLKSIGSSSFLSDKVNQLNELAKNKLNGLLGGLGNFLNLGDKNFLSEALNGLLGKAVGALSGYLNNALQMLKALGTDTLRQITNASINYIANILEDYVNNIKSSIYIDDKVFSATIEGLYYSGADLAYNDHYLRKQCLKRDWVETLKFVDEKYELKYDCTYTNLDSDIKVCSMNSCHKNLFYIFEKLSAKITEYNNLIIDSDKKIDTFTKTENYTDNAEYQKEVKLNNQYKSDKERLEKLMVSGLKNLIVYSYTYTTASDIRKFFTTFPDILKPSYYGSTDTKYNKQYMFDEKDCSTMLPFFTKHDLSKSDVALMEEISKQSSLLDKYNEKSFNSNKFTEARATLNNSTSSSYEKGKAYAIIQREEARYNSLKSQDDRSSSLALTALTKGAKGVHQDSRARYPMQNGLKNKVKYRDEDLSNFLDDTFNTKDQYTVPRNKNIKAIYILLTSKEIYSDSYMENIVFYKRCKYKTMTTLNAAADKALGLLGTSFLAQATYDISDAIDGSAYRYTKQVEKFLLNPKTNISDIAAAANVTFDEDNLEIEEVVSDETDENGNESKTPTIYRSAAVPTNNNTELTESNGVNPESISELEKEADKNLSVKKEIADSVRYTESLPMMSKKAMLLNYLVKFYDLCINYGVDEREFKKAYGRLTQYIFSKNIKDPNDLYGTLLDNATNESLTRNIQIIISIQKTGTLLRIMKAENSQYKNIYVKLFDLVCNSLNLESSTSSFVQMTFNYDKEHLSSLLKHYYLKQLNYLKSINDKSNPNYKNFYTFKDSMTKSFVGFDRNGVFGYSEEKDRLRYTNIETGDWRAIHYSPKHGTFFAGSMNTKGNGIMKLNESIEELRSTNITSGNWLKIVEFNDNLFFINEDQSIWYWNGSSVVKTNITDYDKWEFDLFESYDIIFLKGTNNNGIKIWRNNSFETITDAGDGWVYESLNNNSYYILYPSRTAGMSYVFDISKIFTPTNVRDSIVSWFLTVPQLTYTYEESAPSPENGGESGTGGTSGTGTDGTGNGGTGGEEQTITVTVIQFQCHLLISTKTTGVWDCMSALSDTTLFVPSNTQPQLLTKFDQDKINILYRKTNANSSCWCIDGKNIYSIDFVSVKDGGSAIPDISGNKVIERKTTDTQLLTGGVVSYDITNTLCTKFGIFAEQVKVLENGSSTTELWYYDKESYENNRNKIADKSISGLSFFVGEDGVTSFCKSSDNYFICTKTGMNQLLTNENDIKPGWILEYVNNKFYMVNHTNPLGIKLIRNNVAENTNITDGYWNVTASDTKIFALSIKNTNKGIRYTSVNNPTNFGVISKSPYNYQDVYGYSYDPERKVMYFGSCRDELLLDIDAINYDIDLYIYILTLYQIKQKLQGFANENSSVGLNLVLDKLKEKNGSGEGSGSGSGEGSGSGSGGGGLSENDINEINNLVDSYNSDLQSQISDQREIEKSSSLYTDLLTYAEAIREFDIDDKNAKESLLLSMINNYDYVPSFDDQKMYFSIMKNGSEIFILVTDTSGSPNPDIQYYTRDENGIFHACPKPLTAFEPGIVYYTYDWDNSPKPNPDIQYYTKDENGVYHACPKPLTAFEPGVDYYTYFITGPGPNNQEKFLAKLSYMNMIRQTKIDNNSNGYIRLFNTSYNPDPNIQYYTKDENGDYISCDKPLSTFEPEKIYYVDMKIGSHNWNKQFNQVSDDFLNTDEDFIDYTAE